MTDARANTPRTDAAVDHFYYNNGADTSSLIALARQLEAELATLHERLEDNFCYQDGKRVEVPAGSIPDGIYCRDETIKLLKAELATARAADWKPMELAPKDATEILVLTNDKRGHKGVMIAHYACGGGEEQPPFKGWFFWNGYHFVEVTGTIHGWLPLPDDRRKKDRVEAARDAAQTT